MKAATMRKRPNTDGSTPLDGPGKLATDKAEAQSRGRIAAYPPPAPAGSGAEPYCPAGDGLASVRRYIVAAPQR